MVALGFSADGLVPAELLTEVLPTPDTRELTGLVDDVATMVEKLSGLEALRQHPCRRFVVD